MSKELKFRALDDETGEIIDNISSINLDDGYVYYVDDKDECQRTSIKNLEVSSQAHQKELEALVGEIWDKSFENSFSHGMHIVLREDIEEIAQKRGLNIKI